MSWDALPPHRIEQRVFEALGRNRSYARDVVLGLPGSFLDRQVFPPLPILKGMPLLAAMVDNPNHIGCHTLGASEPGFAGTHDLEREVIAICAEGLLGAEPGSVDGYVASGGTESNLQALWTFRNALRNQGVPTKRIGILCSADTHYSVHKASDLLCLPLLQVPVDPETRRMVGLAEVVQEAKARGLTHLLVVLNMGTTMFGSVDDPDAVLPVIERAGLQALVHVDAAFGGFVYPLGTPTRLAFTNPAITSITLDAHKMLQAPYGTGIHLIRKGWIEHVVNENASYVPGLDCTLSGSRSGTNAIAVWMILRSYGSEGGERFCQELLRRTARLCRGLDRLGVRYFREPGMNVVAMRAEDVPDAVVERFGLVPDDHHAPRWVKVVVMDHVLEAHLDAFVASLTDERGVGGDQQVDGGRQRAVGRQERGQVGA